MAVEGSRERKKPSTKSSKKTGQSRTLRKNPRGPQAAPPHPPNDPPVDEAAPETPPGGAPEPQAAPATPPSPPWPHRRYNGQKAEEILKCKLEAIRLLADWSKWLIAVETGGVVGVLAVLLKLEWLPRSGWLTIAVPACLCAAAVLFVASIYYASQLLVSLPNVGEHLHGKIIKRMGIDDEMFSIWTARDLELDPLENYANLQLKLFTYGLISTVAAVFCVGSYSIHQGMKNQPLGAPAAGKIAQPDVNQPPGVMKK